MDLRSVMFVLLNQVTEVGLLMTLRFTISLDLSTSRDTSRYNQYTLAHSETVVAELRAPIEPPT